MRRARFKKWAKWACTGAAGLMVALAMSSKFCRCSYTAMTNSGDTEWYAELGGGVMRVSRSDGWRNVPRRPTARWAIGRSGEWYWGWGGDASLWLDRAYWHAGVMCSRSALSWKGGVSLLYPVALTLLPAALLWYTDRRRWRPDQCKGCGYDRRGLATATSPCPECGRAPRE